MGSELRLSCSLAERAARWHRWAIMAQLWLRLSVQELGLNPPVAPWHTQRDQLATLICACGVLTGSLGKMARDIALLMQNEVGEANEPGGEGRGGSSTMPNKRNPTACSLTLAAAHRVPGLVASFLSAMVQEHERAVGGWQAEWPVVASVVQSTGVAIASMAEVAEGLSVDTVKDAGQHREHKGIDLCRAGDDAAGIEARARRGP